MKQVLALALFLWTCAVQAGDALVHVVSFFCPHCSALEAYAPGIEAQARAHGITYVFAPVSLREGTTYAPELSYFAARDIDLGAARDVRRLMFFGAEEGVPFEDMAQVVEWLRLHAPARSDLWEALPRLVQEDNPRAALYRAYKLVTTAGVKAVPAFVWVRDGVVMGSVQRGEGESMSEFAKRVSALISAMKER